MKFDQLSTRQKAAARTIRDQLHELGVGASVSQVAIYFDAAMQWRNNTISLAELCDTAGWTMPPPANPVEAVRTAKAAVLAAGRQFREALRAAHGSDVPVDTLITEAQGVLSETAVRKTLGLETLTDKARRILAHVDLGTDVLVIRDRDNVTLNLDGDILDSGHADRANYGSNVINELERNGIRVELPGWMDTDLGIALADNHTVNLYEADTTPSATR